ncbi:MAG: peptidoglycan/xylan/chitin deacetylase (PgdA/CDA1 family) [Rhodothermales bacterium]
MKVYRYGGHCVHMPRPLQKRAFAPSRAVDTTSVTQEATSYPETYAEWRRLPLRSLPRRAARNAAIAALYASFRLSGKLTAGLAVPRVQFFCLHHLFPDEEGPFRSKLSTLSEHFDFVPWSVGVRMVLEGRRPERPVACFSSDDGFASNLALARVLEEFGTTGCFFLNPASLDQTDDQWVSRFCRTRLQAQPTRFLSSADVDGLLARGHEVGNHTMTHVVCSETPADRLWDEVQAARHQLEARFGPVVHFAWPYGQYDHFSEVARSAVFETGHISAASVVRGAHLVAASEGGSPFTGDLCLRRDQMWAKDPVEHTLYFAAHNALHPQVGANEFPGLIRDQGLRRTGLADWDAIPLPDARNQYAPLPPMAARNVRRRIARSSQIDQFRT